MSGFRIKPQQLVKQKTPPVKRGSYLEFIRRLPCIVTGNSGGVEAAHLSAQNIDYGHYGRGRGTRASDRWVLPLSAAQHRFQHTMAESSYWKQVHINPYIACLILWGIWSDYGDDGHDLCVDAIRRIRAKRLD